MGVKLEIYNKEKTINRLTKNDKVGLFMAETCMRYMDAFIPFDTGMLAQNYTTEPFKVTYEVPYAERIFYGEGFNFQREKHPLATARWDRACSNAKGKQIAKEVEEYIRSM